MYGFLVLKKLSSREKFEYSGRESLFLWKQTVFPIST